MSDIVWPPNSAVTREPRQAVRAELCHPFAMLQADPGFQLYKIYIYIRMHEYIYRCMILGLHLEYEIRILAIIGG